MALLRNLLRPSYPKLTCIDLAFVFSLLNSHAIYSSCQAIGDLRKASKRMDAMLASLVAAAERLNCYYLEALIGFASLGFKGIIQKEIEAMVIAY